MNSDKDKIKISFLGKWVLFSFIGGIIGLLVAFFVGEGIFKSGLLSGLCIGLIGAGVGYSQWLVLKKHITLSSKWGLACAIGIEIPFIVAIILEELGVKLPNLPLCPPVSPPVAPVVSIISQTAVGIIGGLLSGLLQTHILKPFRTKVNLWILASTLGWGFYFLIFSIPNLMADLLQIVLSGLISGFITGVFILYILSLP